MSQCFYMPVKVIYGPHCVAENAALFAGFGKKALIVTSPSSAKNGALQEVTEALSSQGIAWGVFDRCENNPSLEMTDCLGEFARQDKYDFVIGIGGGSAMDSAKAASVLAVNDYPAAKLFENRFPHAPLPLIEVPTTAGTGSEVTYNAVITIDGGRNKKSFGTPVTHAKLAFLDARYTETLPMRLTRYTALDALAHAIEGFLSCKATPAGSMVAKEVFRIFAKNHGALCGDSLTPAVRQELLLNAMYAGIVIAQERTIAVHSLSYPLTAMRGVQHGLAVSLPMASFLEICYSGAKEKIDELLGILGLTELGQFRGYIGRLMDDKNTYTRAEVEEFVSIAGQGAIGRNNPVTLTLDDVRNIYLTSLALSD